MVSTFYGMGPDGIEKGLEKRNRIGDHHSLRRWLYCSPCIFVASFRGFSGGSIASITKMLRPAKSAIPLPPPIPGAF